ncbi:sulfotransferase [Rhodobacter sp. 24-YEA-8]|uniref:sulfotransferase family protein n=1 Tax=Rhodobacter sp. 24-YEA-8 TaxID=1884310 RepID=UPI00089BE964|nr:Sulfotransferase family protein [Rhodobacter sp. 24-YEA-8]
MAETGFLSGEDPPLFSAKLYIAAMGRSGSTALSNMLTTPPKRWLLSEPWFIHGVMSKTIRARWKEFAWEDRDTDWFLPPAQRNHEGFVRRYTDFLAPHLAGLDAWGVKEVRGDFHEPTIVTIRPEKIIVLVRDIRDVIRSLLEKQSRQNTEATHGRAWIEAYLQTATRALVSLAGTHGDRLRVCRFEELMLDPAAQRSLGDWLDWPLDGDPFAGFESFGRGYEVKRRLEGEARVLPPDAADIINDIAAGEASVAYQKCFGYSS